MTFYGSGVGLFAAIASAGLFSFNQLSYFYNSEFGRDKLETLFFEYPGDVGFLNDGEGNLVVQSISLEWPDSEFKRQPLLLPVSLMIRPGEVQFFHLLSQYPEPAKITTADWKFGPPSSAEIKDAFAIGKGDRCSVFHVYSKGFPIFDVIEQSHDQADNQHLTTIPAIVKVNTFHLNTGVMTSEDVQSETAFLQIENCKPKPKAG